MTQADDAQQYDPMQWVPDEIDIVTASGLEALHPKLSSENRAKLESVSPVEQGHLFWKMVESGHVKMAGFKNSSESA